LDGDVTPTTLPGGRRHVWRAGSVVLKPLDADPAALAWIEDVTMTLDGRDDFRVAPPLRSAAGELVSDGWTAWRFEPGKPVGASPHTAWRDVIRVSDDLNRALIGWPRPTFLDDRKDRWSFADRLAWSGFGEPSGVAIARTRSSWASVCAVMEHTQPIDAPAQIIHGDLAGNVLFVAGRPPCVIDFSPYWRPAAAAIATVVVDAVTFHAGGRSLIESQMHRPDFGQYLLRALIFRMASDAVTPVRPPFASDRDDPYLETLRAVLRAMEHGDSASVS
jgi:uncharacterized protein (TIGR02569 family)